MAIFDVEKMYKITFKKINFFKIEIKLNKKIINLIIKYNKMKKIDKNSKKNI